MIFYVILFWTKIVNIALHKTYFYVIFCMETGAI